MTAIKSKKVAKTKARPKCMNCTRREHSRGLCMACYQAAARKVRAKETNWGELVEAGLALPSRMGQKSNPNRFDAKFTKFKSAKSK